MMNSNARGSARVVRRAPRGARREKAHVATCVQTPRMKIAQLSIGLINTLIVNKRQTIILLYYCNAMPMHCMQHGHESSSQIDYRKVYA